MRALLGRCLASLLLAVGMHALAQADARIDAKTAETLMHQSGLWQQLADVGPQFRAAFAAAAASGDPPAPATELARIDRLVEQAYAAPRLRAVASRTLVAGTPRSDVPLLAAWYGGAVGRHFTRLEEAAGSDPRDPAEQYEDGGQRLAAASSTRRALIERLNEASHAVEAATAITIDTALAVQVGMSRARPDGPAPSMEELRSALEDERPQLAALYAAQTLAGCARIYSDSSDEELAQYIAFLETPAGQHFTEVSLQALEAALIDAAMQLGQGLPGAKDASNV